MPTFQNPVADADEAREAMRGLAYATRHFDRAEDTYRVLGDLTRTVEGLQQVLTQLAAWHAAHQSRAATDTGDRAVGAADAVAAADALTSAAAALDGVWESMNQAWSHNGAIAWQLTAPPPRPRGFRAEPPGHGDEPATDDHGHDTAGRRARGQPVIHVRTRSRAGFWGECRCPTVQ